jgi:hypothetical protein
VTRVRYRRHRTVRTTSIEETVKHRAARLGAAVAGAVATLVLTTAPALAVVRDDGTDPGQSLGWIPALLIFIGIPVLLYVVIGSLVALPGLARQPRYRPNRGGWNYAPQWFSGPDDPTVALEAVQPSSGEKGGAHGDW